jgi:hypothetical protein
LVTQKDLTILMTHLWCSDDHDYLHERHRVQLSFLLIVFSATGARAGAIVESSSYRGTNQALAYKVCQALAEFYFANQLGLPYSFVAGS